MPLRIRPAADRRDPAPPTGSPLRGVLTGVSIAVLAVLAVFAATVVAEQRRPTPAAPSAPPAAEPAVPAGVLRPVRDGTLGPGWQDWSWAATVVPGGTAPDGTAAVQVTFREGFAGLSLRQSTATRPAASALLRARVWVEGAGSWLGLTVQVDDRSPGLHGPDTQATGGRWVTLTAPVRALGRVDVVKRVTLEHRSAELRGADRPVRVWVAELTLG